MATQDADIEEVKRALTAKKKNFTRQYNSAGEITQFASTNPSPSAAPAVTAAKERVTRAYGEALDVLDDLFIRDEAHEDAYNACLLYTSPSPRDKRQSRMPSSA